MGSTVGLPDNRFRDVMDLAGAKRSREVVTPVL
jgi:hypothetical protein